MVVVVVVPGYPSEWGHQLQMQEGNSFLLFFFSSASTRARQPKPHATEKPQTMELQTANHAAATAGPSWPFRKTATAAATWTAAGPGLDLPSYIALYCGGRRSVSNSYRADRRSVRYSLLHRTGKPGLVGLPACWPARLPAPALHAQASSYTVDPWLKSTVTLLAGTNQRWEKGAELPRFAAAGSRRRHPTPCLRVLCTFCGHVCRPMACAAGACASSWRGAGVPLKRRGLCLYILLVVSGAIRRQGDHRNT